MKKKNFTSVQNHVFLGEKLRVIDVENMLKMGNFVLGVSYSLSLSCSFVFYQVTCTVCKGPLS